MLDAGLEAADGDKADREPGDDMHDAVGLHTGSRTLVYDSAQVDSAAESISEAPPSIRVSITIPVELDEWLDEWARRRGVPKAVLIRMLLLASRERQE